MILTEEIKQKIKDIFSNCVNYPMAFHVQLKNNQDFVEELKQYLKNYPEYCTVNLLIKCICIDYKFKICEICHKPIPYLKRKNRFCSSQCKGKCKEITNKIQSSLQKTLSDPVKKTEIQNKIKQTNLQRYGVINPFQSKEIQEKVRQTNLQRYGVINPFQSEKIKEKIKQTNLKRYRC